MELKHADQVILLMKRKWMEMFAKIRFIIVGHFMTLMILEKNVYAASVVSSP